MHELLIDAQKETTLQDLSFMCRECGSIDPLEENSQGSFCPGCGKEKAQ